MFRGAIWDLQPNGSPNDPKTKIWSQVPLRDPSWHGDAASARKPPKATPPPHFKLEGTVCVALGRLDPSRQTRTRTKRLALHPTSDANASLGLEGLGPAQSYGAAYIQPHFVAALAHSIEDLLPYS